MRGRMQNSKRVLIADNDPVMRCIVTAAVTGEGYTPVTVSDGPRRTEFFSLTLILPPPSLIWVCQALAELISFAT